MWEDDHEYNERYQEYRHQNNGDAIEVLLNDARSLVRTIHARSDHIRNAVPLPECNRMKIMSPMPERTSKTEKMIASTDKLIPYLIRFMPYKTLIMTNSLLLFKKRFCGHFARQRNPDHIEQRWRDIREDTARILERIALVRTIDQDERHGAVVCAVNGVPSSAIMQSALP